MKIIVSFIICLYQIVIFSTNSNIINAETNELNKMYIDTPEKFVHINADCKVCMISRPANAGCVIVENSKVILVKDSRTKKIGLPGGKKNKQETAIFTAQRNATEETGRIVYIDDFVSEFKNGFRLYKCKVIKNTETINTNKTLDIIHVDKKELGELLKKDNRKNLRFPHELDLIYSKFEWIVK